MKSKEGLEAAIASKADVILLQGTERRNPGLLSNTEQSTLLLIKSIDELVGDLSSLESVFQGWQRVVLLHSLLSKLISMCANVKELNRTALASGTFLLTLQVSL